MRAWMAAKDQELQGARQLAARQAGEVREYARSEDRNAASLSSISGTLGAITDSLARLKEYDATRGETRTLREVRGLDSHLDNLRVAPDDAHAAAAHSQRRESTRLTPTGGHQMLTSASLRGASSRRDLSLMSAAGSSPYSSRRGSQTGSPGLLRDSRHLQMKMTSDAWRQTPWISRLMRSYGRLCSLCSRPVPQPPSLRPEVVAAKG